LLQNLPGSKEGHLQLVRLAQIRSVCDKGRNNGNRRDSRRRCKGILYALVVDVARLELQFGRQVVQCIDRVSDLVNQLVKSASKFTFRVLSRADKVMTNKKKVLLSIYLISRPKRPASGH